MRRLPLIFTLAALTLAGSISAEPREDDNVQMTADRLELDVEAKTAVLAGHVKLSKGAMSLGCPHVDVRFDHVPHVTWAKGTGGVVAEVKGVRAEAPEVEVDLAAHVMDLRGGVKLTRGDGWISAEKARIDIATAKVTLTDVKGSIPVPKPSSSP